MYTNKKQKKRPGPTRNKHNYKDHYKKSKKIKALAKELNAKFTLKG